MSSMDDYLTELVREEGVEAPVLGRAVTTQDGEVGYYVTKDHGETWNRVHRPTYWLARLLERLA